MKIFDFLKPKKAKKNVNLTGFLNNNPDLWKTILAMKTEEIKSQADNLIAVGREDEAMKVKTNHIESIFELWWKDKDSLQDPALINLNYIQSN